MFAYNRTTFTESDANVCLQSHYFYKKRCKCLRTIALLLQKVMQMFAYNRTTFTKSDANVYNE